MNEYIQQLIDKGRKTILERETAREEEQKPRLAAVREMLPEPLREYAEHLSGKTYQLRIEGLHWIMFDVEFVSKQGRPHAFAPIEWTVVRRLRGIACPTLEEALYQASL